MSHPPRGSDVQPRTDAALFGWIAAGLEGTRIAELGDWVKELGIDVGVDGLRKAPLRSPRLQEGSRAPEALRKRLLVDWAELDFFVAAVRLRLERGGGERLARVPGVVDLHLLEGGRAAHLVVIFERRSEQEALERRLAEFGDIDSWDSVDSHHPESATFTARHLAREAARREGLLLPDV